MQLAPSGHVTDRSPAAAAAAAAAAVAGGGLTQPGRLRRLLSSLSCAERARRRRSLRASVDELYVRAGECAKRLRASTTRPVARAGWITAMTS